MPPAPAPAQCAARVRRRGVASPPGPAGVACWFRAASGALALAGCASLVGCDRLTAPEALRAATRMTAALLPAKTGAWAPEARRNAFAHFHGRLPAGSPVTVLVDGAPLEFRAIVWERAVEGWRGPARCTRPLRTLFAWRGDPVEEGFLLSGEVLPGPLRWTGPMQRCYEEGGPGAPPVFVAFPRDSLEQPWYGVAGDARIDAPTLAEPCPLRTDPAELFGRLE